MIKSFYDMQHNIEDLVFENGKVFLNELSLRGERQEYMAAQEITITEKEGAFPSSDGDGTGCYNFGLSDEVQPIWLEIFNQNKALHGFEAVIGSSGLMLRCFPKDLQSEYDQVKEIIHKTNTDYRIEREKLIANFESEEKRRAEEEEQYNNWCDQVEEAFDKLIL